MLLMGRKLAGNEQMDRRFVKLLGGCLPSVLVHPRSQASVYRTIGPLVSQIK